MLLLTCPQSSSCIPTNLPMPSDNNGAVLPLPAAVASLPHWAKMVFLTSCLAAVVGCGILSLQGHRSRQRQSRLDLRRRFLSRHHSKGASGTVTSSEDDEYEDSEEEQQEKNPRPHISEVSADYGQSCPN